MYDAAGVRRAVSIQARILNQMIDEAFQGHPIAEKRLRELIGHTPIQVFVGALLGIGIGFIPPLLNTEAYQEARSIDETEARQLARRLAKEEGIFAGVSTGLNVVGALQIARELGSGHTVVTVAVDTALKYRAGNLYEVYP